MIVRSVAPGLREQAPRLDNGLPQLGAIPLPIAGGQEQLGALASIRP